MNQGKDDEQKNPDSFDFQNFLAFAYDQLGRFEDAARSYTAALKLRPERRGLLLRQAILMLKAGDNQRARAFLHQYEQGSQVCPETSFLRGLLAAKDGPPEEVVKLFGQAASQGSMGIPDVSLLHEASPGPLRELCSTGLGLITQALRTDPKNAHLTSVRGHLQRVLGNTAAAWDDFLQASVLYSSSRFNVEFDGHLRCVNELLRLNPSLFLERLDVGDVRSSPALRRTPDGHPEFDLSEMRRSRPEEVLKGLIRLRCEVVAWECQHSRAFGIFPLLSQLRLVNPILLATAIATSIQRGEDYKSILARYAMGEALDDLDQEFLVVKAIETEADFAAMLAMEAKYIRAFTLLALENLLHSDLGKYYFPNSYATETSKTIPLEDLARRVEVDWSLMVPYDELQYKNTKDLPPEWQFNAFHLHLHSWVLANPLLLALGWTASVCLLHRHGVEINSAIHNAREYYEYRLAESQKRMNEVVGSSRSKQEKRSLLEQERAIHTNLTRLVRRALTLYYWNPMEAEAGAIVATIGTSKGWWASIESDRADETSDH